MSSDVHIVLRPVYRMGDDGKVETVLNRGDLFDISYGGRLGFLDPDKPMEARKPDGTHECLIAAGRKGVVVPESAVSYVVCLDSKIAELWLVESLCPDTVTLWRIHGDKASVTFSWKEFLGKLKISPDEFQQKAFSSVFSKYLADGEWCITPPAYPQG